LDLNRKYDKAKRYVAEALEDGITLRDERYFSLISQKPRIAIKLVSQNIAMLSL
jgi:hypothetical protein